MSEDYRREKGKRPPQLEKHIWKKGCKPPNPAGRPKGFRGVAKMIRKETEGGKELVDFALSVFRGEHEMSTKFSERWAAFEWLADRGYGKAVQMIDLKESQNSDDLLDSDNMTDDDLRALAEAAAIMDRVRRKKKPIDV